MLIVIEAFVLKRVVNMIRAFEFQGRTQVKTCFEIHLKCTEKYTMKLFTVIYFGAFLTFISYANVP